MSNVENISVVLTPDMVETLRAAVASGAYASSGEVVREALREWQEQRQERILRIAAIKVKIDQAADNPERLTDSQVSEHFDRLFASVQTQKAS